MIKTIQSYNVYDVISNISALNWLVDLYSNEPTPKNTTYWWISTSIQSPSLWSNKWAQIKEARVSITIVSAHSDNLSIYEEVNIDNILNIITQNIVDEDICKINSRWDITSLYCIESNTTPLFFTQWNRSYKIKDFLIWYESQNDQ
jgi:hypothetical protein